MLDTRSRLEPPVVDLDPFSTETLEHPFPFQEALREAGSVVMLSKYGIYAVGRYDEVKTVLTDHSRFTTTAGVGLTDIRKPDSLRVKNPLLEVDPPDHTGIRAGLMKIMSPIVVRRWKATFEREADALVEQLLASDRIDAVRDVSETFVCKVFPDTVGITVEREKVLQFGDLNFNANGPRNELYLRSYEKVEPLLPWFEEAFQRRNMTPGGMGAQIYEAEDAGVFSPGTAVGLVRVMFRGGFDTTIAGISAALNQMARSPGQWSAFRENPRQAVAVFDEALRHDSPAQLLSRTTVAGEVELGEYRLPGDMKITAFIGAGNRDPRRWPDPDRFDIQREVSGSHLAFGAGPHICIGMLISKFEAEAILVALAKRIKTIELDGTPTYRLVNTLRTLASLPLRITRA